jgi:hypothetical protein
VYIDSLRGFTLVFRTYISCFNQINPPITYSFSITLLPYYSTVYSALHCITLIHRCNVSWHPHNCLVGWSSCTGVSNIGSITMRSSEEHGVPTAYTNVWSCTIPHTLKCCIREETWKSQRCNNFNDPQCVLCLSFSLCLPLSLSHSLTHLAASLDEGCKLMDHTAIPVQSPAGTQHLRCQHTIARALSLSLSLSPPCPNALFPRLGWTFLNHAYFLLIWALAI